MLAVLFMELSLKLMGVLHMYSQDTVSNIYSSGSRYLHCITEPEGFSQGKVFVNLEGNFYMLHSNHLLNNHVFIITDTEVEAESQE